VPQIHHRSFQFFERAHGAAADAAERLATSAT